MNGVRFVRLLGSVGVIGGLALSACGGESVRNFDEDDGSGAEAGDPSGSGGSSAGASATGGRGGTAPGGSTATGGRGGTAAGGSTATGGAPTGGVGGTDIDGVCDEILPCGGDPEGSWNVRENCAETLIPGVIDRPGCEDVIGRASATVTGSFTFSNGVVTQDMLITPYVTAVITDACAQNLVGSDMITAADLCPVLDAALMDNPETPLRCAPTTEGCECAGAQAPVLGAGTDSYEIVGSQLIFGSGDVYDFCQDGDELHFHGNPVVADTGDTLSLTLLLDRI